MKPDELVCIYCGRIGRRRYAVASGNPDLEPGRTSWCCSSRATCEARQTSGAQQCLADNPDGYRCATWTKDCTRLCRAHWVPLSQRLAKGWQR